jgi:TolA-binding protein
MMGRFAALFILATLDSGFSLDLKKTEAVEATKTSGPGLCIFGICISGKKDYDSSVKTHETRDQTIEELNKKVEEMDMWKKEDDERKQLEEDERRAKQQEEKDSVIAQSCQCTWACGDRNDGTVCFRKCCNNEFGGNPNSPGVALPGSGALPVVAGAPAAAAPAAPAFPVPAFNPFAAYNPFAAALPAGAVPAAR